MQACATRLKLDSLTLRDCVGVVAVAVAVAVAVVVAVVVVVTVVVVVVVVVVVDIESPSNFQKAAQNPEF